MTSLASIFVSIKEQGLTNKAAAQKVGVDLEHLALLGSADRCSFDDVKKRCSAPGVPLPDGYKKSASA